MIDTKKTVLGIMTGILTGVSTGIILGVLFAPNKGSKTRRKIAKKGEYLADEANHQYHKVVNNISDKIDGVEQSTETLLQKGKDMISKN